MNAAATLLQARRDKRFHRRGRQSVTCLGEANWLDLLASMLAEGDYTPKPPKRSREDRSAGIPERLSRLA